MRVYNVQISAKIGGHLVNFTEVIAFPVQAEHENEEIPAPIREVGAVEQIRVKYPELREIKAVGSRHVCDFDIINHYLPFPLVSV